MSFKYFNRSGKVISCEHLREARHKVTGQGIGVIASIPGFSEWPTGWPDLATMKGEHPELHVPILVAEKDIAYREIVVVDGELKYADEVQAPPATA